MGKAAADSGSIDVLPPQWQRSALLLLGVLPDDPLIQQLDRAAEQPDAAGLSLPGLLGVWDGDGLLGVVWAQLQPGRTATIWPPRIVGQHEGLGARLALAAVEVAASRGARIAQALLSPNDVAEETWLEAAGLHRAADVECLVWHVPSSPAADSQVEPLPAPWRAERYEHARHRLRMEQLLEKTFVDSLDCPALEGARQAADVLDGYLAAGAAGSDRWYFIHGDDGDAGCLLLAEHTDKAEGETEMELVYMGLTPPWRGRGLGGALVQLAQWLTRRSGRSRLLTAVDIANAPARAAYYAAGFFCWERRRVLLRVFK